MPAYTAGRNTNHRRASKTALKEAGQARAPALVKKPTYKCTLCQNDTILTEPVDGIRLCSNCIEASKDEQLMELTLQDDLEWISFFMFAVLDDWRSKGCKEDPCSPELASDLGLLPSYRQPVKFTAPEPVNKEELIEKAVMKKAPIDPDKVDEMFEAVQYAVENWSNKDARLLPSGYQIYISPGVPIGCDAPIKKPGQLLQWIIFRHPDIPQRVVVGSTDLKTGNMNFVSRRSEIREYMLMVEAGPQHHDPRIGPVTQFSGFRSANTKTAKKPVRATEMALETSG